MPGRSMAIVAMMQHMNTHRARVKSRPPYWAMVLAPDPLLPEKFYHREIPTMNMKASENRIMFLFLFSPLY